MNNAIIYLKNTDEENLATAEYLGSSLVEILISKFLRTHVDKVYIVGTEKTFNGAENKENLDGALKAIKSDSEKTILISPFYPNLKKTQIEALLNAKDEGSVLVHDDTVLRIYSFSNKSKKNYLDIDYSRINVDSSSAYEIDDAEELRKYEKKERLRINKKLLRKGVNILDLENTYISPFAQIEKGATIYPNVFIYGKTIIRKRATITSSSFLLNSEIGEDTEIINSRIDTCIIHNKVKIGPMAHLRMQCEVFDEARIGNFVELKNVRFGKGSKCAHLTYLGDSVIGDDVNIGCGVVTVNYDGKNKFATIIKNHAFVGSNVNLIAPVTVGSYAVVAAGSTVTDDVKDNDMAIARARQITKEGYGYKYIKKEN